MKNGGELFDLLYLEGRDLSGEPYTRRRHGSYKGLREDKPARSVHVERPSQ